MEIDFETRHYYQFYLMHDTTSVYMPVDIYVDDDDWIGIEPRSYDLVDSFLFLGNCGYNDMIDSHTKSSTIVTWEYSGE